MYSSDGYQALREASAVIRRRDRGVLAVSGTDRLAWLQGLLTNDVAALREGESCYAAYLTPQGRMISDMRVVHLDQRTLLEVPAPLADALRTKLDSLLFTEDAQVADLSSDMSVIDLIGPESTGVLERAGGRVGALATIHDDLYGVPGMTLFLEAAHSADAIRAIIAAGAVETTLETLDVLRIESGHPLFLVDMDGHTIPLEAGIEDRAVSFTKGCYVGQEVIVRVMHRGQGRVAKKLVGLLLPKDAAARTADSIRSGDREIGRVTSATWSPALARHIALGYVHRDFAVPGTRADVQTQQAVVPATVAVLPFVGPARQQ
jgi:tRNA-modifying protein YgfZ